MTRNSLKRLFILYRKKKEKQKTMNSSEAEPNLRGRGVLQINGLGGKNSTQLSIFQLLNPLAACIASGLKSQPPPTV